MANGRFCNDKPGAIKNKTARAAKARAVVVPVPPNRVSRDYFLAFLGAAGSGTVAMVCRIRPAIL